MHLEPGGFSEVKYPGVAFAPGGVTTGVGSAYDNDIADRTVRSSRNCPTGATSSPTATTSTDIEFPGLTPNGSHILMQTKATTVRSHLYMRVNQASPTTSRGAPASGSPA